MTMEGIFLQQLEQQGFSVIILCLVAYFFYKEHLKVKDYFLNENKELKHEIKEIKDNYDNFIKRAFEEQSEIIRQNTEALNEVREIFLKLKR